MAEEHLQHSEARLLSLTQSKSAIVDADDYDRLSRHKWYAYRVGNSFYAARHKNGTTVQMHREILNAPKGMECDHINHNGLDNRKANLRICTHSQNQQNRRPCTGCTSRYKGVYRYGNKWRAGVRFNGTRLHLGCFDREAEAACAYDDMAAELFGEFACLNLS